MKNYLIFCLFQFLLFARELPAEVWRCDSKPERNSGNSSLITDRPVRSNRDSCKKVLLERVPYNRVSADAFASLAQGQTKKEISLDSACNSQKANNQDCSSK